MTANEFAAICGEYLLDPALALENERVVNAVRADDIEELHKALEEEF